jgi:hypothetical protein
MWLFFAWDGWVETTFQFHFEHSLHAATCVCVCVSAQCQLFLSNPCHYHGKPGTSQLRCSTCISCLGFSQSQLRHLDRNWLMPKTTTWHFCIKKTHWIWVTPNYWRRLFSKFLEPLELEMTPDKVNPRLQLSSVIVFWLVVWNMFFSIQLGIIIPTDVHIFQRGWNHQPDCIRCIMALICWLHPPFRR